MKLRADQTLHALSMRGWVELRACKVPPKAYTTTLPTQIQVTESQRNMLPMLVNGRYQWPTKVVPKTITLKTTTWDGGKVLGAMTSHRFILISKIATPRNGTSIKLTREVAEKLLKELEIKDVA